MIALPIRSRPLVQALTRTTPPLSKTSTHPTLCQRRTLFGFFKDRYKFGAKPSTPLTEEYLTRKPTNAETPTLKRGDLASSSIFDEGQEKGLSVQDASKRKGTLLNATSSSRDSLRTPARNPQVMAAALDPDPDVRKRWERKMIIREIHKRGRLTRTQALRRAEHSMVSKSHNIRTSVKKLGPLARQIAGKSIEEAIVQMRFSAKKASKEVLEHLEQARNEAIVSRGMGLGPELEEPRRIVTNDGRRLTVRKDTGLYVSQAWVGKGEAGKSLEHRARGRSNLLNHPSTHIAVMLKEEKTRIRLHDEKVEKERRRKTWIQLPNRPINHQRQHYSW